MVMNMLLISSIVPSLISSIGWLILLRVGSGCRSIFIVLLFTCWCRRSESNTRFDPYQGSVLPIYDNGLNGALERNRTSTYWFRRPVAVSTGEGKIILAILRA